MTLDDGTNVTFSRTAGDLTTRVSVKNMPGALFPEISFEYSQSKGTANTVEH